MGDYEVSGSSDNDELSAMFLYLSCIKQMRLYIFDNYCGVTKMQNKPDAQGGNANVYFDDENNTATKYLRNTSSVVPIKRFVQEQQALKIISTYNIPNIVEVLDIYIDESNVTKSFIKMKKYDGSLYDLFDTTKGNVKLSLQMILPIAQYTTKNQSIWCNLLNGGQ